MLVALTSDAAGHVASCDLAAVDVRVVLRADGGRSCSGEECHDGEVNACSELHDTRRRVKVCLRIELRKAPKDWDGLRMSRASTSFDFLNVDE